METKFGWRRRVISNDRNPRSLRNFPVQGNAAEILRLSSCLCTESGLKVLGTLHDALLVEAEADQLGQVVAKATGLMMAAAWAVLDGFPIRVQEKCYAFPKRYQDERGVPMWNQVMAILGEVESQPGSESRAELEGYAG